MRGGAVLLAPVLERFSEQPVSLALSGNIGRVYQGGLVLNAVRLSAAALAYALREGRHRRGFAAASRTLLGIVKYALRFRPLTGLLCVELAYPITDVRIVFDVSHLVPLVPLEGGRAALRALPELPFSRDD